MSNSLKKTVLHERVVEELLTAAEGVIEQFCGQESSQAGTEEHFKRSQTFKCWQSQRMSIISSLKYTTNRIG